MSKNYTFVLSKQATRDHLALMRQLLYAADQSVVPLKVHYETDPSEVLEPSYFARRISLLTHYTQKQVDLSDHKQRFTFRNDTDSRRAVYSEEMAAQAEVVKPLEARFLLFFLDPKQQIRFTLEYQRGIALDDAKFCTLGKLRFEFEKEPYKIHCTSVRDMEQVIRRVRGLIKAEIQKLED